ncbi:MAG: DUF4097 family beta strand repeat-containing protein [Acidimicrobiales bacterium]|jgi:DUF4097 and DUF4098 domain-containing protein YvlB
MSQFESINAGPSTLRETAERSFETPGPVSLHVENAAGSVAISTHEVARTEIRLVSLHPSADGLVKTARIGERLAASGHEITVEVQKSWTKRALFSSGAGVAVEVRVPNDTALEIFTASASVTAQGGYRAADVNSASGDIAIEKTVGPAKVRTAGGSVELGNVSEANVNSASGDVTIAVATAGGKISTASGDIELGRAEDVTSLRSASGDVRIKEALKGASVETVSGDQHIELASGGDYVLRAVSGDITVAIAPGSLVRIEAASVSGEVRSEIDLEASRDAAGGPSDARELSVKVKTVSGDISVVRAAS